jgi:hypothetical protein
MEVPSFRRVSRRELRVAGGILDKSSASRATACVR